MTKIDIVSGFLGAGKTTLIKKLLKEALAGTKVVLIENEFGEIGIDGGFLKESGIEIRAMNAGCICCSLVGDCGTASREVLETYSPERILIEPSGVGKLSDVMRAINDASEHTQMHLNSAVAVVDAAKCKVYLKNFVEFFDNQIAYAGTIILSRTDKISAEKIDECVELLRAINKDATIITTPIAQLDGRMILDTIEGTADLQKQILEEVLAADYDDEDEDEHEHHHHHHGDEDEEHGHHHHHHGDEDEDEEHEHHHHHHDEDEDEEHGHHHHHHGDEDEDEEHGHHHHHDEDEDEEHGHHHHHHHDEDEDEEHEHHHHHHHEDEDEEHEHHHHHHDEDEDDGVDEDGDRIYHTHDYQEKHGGHHHHHHHHHHHGHDADEVFGSWGMETPSRFTADEIAGILKELENEEKYGYVLRSKGMVQAPDGTWIHFDYVPEESEIRTGAADVTGKICVIGAKLDEEALEKLFKRKKA